MLRGTTQKKASPLAVILSCKTNLDIFQYMTQQYVTIVLATFFNFAHGVLYLRPVVYYSRCLLFFFLYYHVATTLLFIIFKCTILICPLCSLHELTWIYYDYYYYYFECYISITKKILSFQKGPFLVWFTSLCVCFLSFIFLFC